MKLRCKASAGGCGVLIPVSAMRSAAAGGVDYHCACGRVLDAGAVVEKLDRALAARRDPKKLARTGDPETSHEAAREIVAELPEARRHALSTVSKWPNCTSLELARKVGDPDPRKINRRLGELEKLRLVKRTGTRRCTISNRNATTWEIA